MHRHSKNVPIALSNDLLLVNAILSTVNSSYRLLAASNFLGNNKIKILFKTMLAIVKNDS